LPSRPSIRRTLQFPLRDRTHPRVSSPGGRHCGFLVSVPPGEVVTGVDGGFEGVVRRSAVICGKTIRLRTVRETDIDRLYALLTDIAHRGDFVPLRIPSEATFKRRFHETGVRSE